MDDDDTTGAPWDLLEPLELIPEGEELPDAVDFELLKTLDRFNAHIKSGITGLRDEGHHAKFIVWALRQHIEMLENYEPTPPPLVDQVLVEVDARTLEKRRREIGASLHAAGIITSPDRVSARLKEARKQLREAAAPSSDLGLAESLLEVSPDARAEIIDDPDLRLHLREEAVRLQVSAGTMTRLVQLGVVPPLRSVEMDTKLFHMAGEFHDHAMKRFDDLDQLDGEPPVDVTSTGSIRNRPLT